MRKSVIAVVLACCLVVTAGCSSTIKNVSAEVWDSLKKIAKEEGAEAAEARIEQAKKDLQAKGIDPDQIDSMAKLMLEYLKKRDSEKGVLDWELIMNLALAYAGVNMVKRKMLVQKPEEKNDK